MSILRQEIEVAHNEPREVKTKREGNPGTHTNALMQSLHL